MSIAESNPCLHDLTTMRFEFVVSRPSFLSVEKLIKNVDVSLARKLDDTIPIGWSSTIVLCN